MIILVTSDAVCPHADFVSIPLKLFAMKRFVMWCALHTIVVFGNAQKGFVENWLTAHIAISEQWFLITCNYWKKTAVVCEASILELNPVWDL